VLRDFSKTVEKILEEWHFPNATDVYFDEVTRDIVIGGRARGSRVLAFAPSRILHLPLLYSSIAGHARCRTPVSSSLIRRYSLQGAERRGRRHCRDRFKPRFYEHLSKFAGKEQIFIVDNTTPPESSSAGRLSLRAILRFRATASSRTCQRAINLAWLVRGQRVLTPR